MGGIIDYVKEKGHLAFDDLAFNEVDSLVLAQLAYLKYDEMTNNEYSFHQLLSCVPTVALTECTFNPSGNDALLHAVAQSKRFENIVITHHVNILDPDSEKQFAAVTYHLSDNLHYVAFRGTVATLVGWKEDFNLSFSNNIPSQCAAAEYFEKMADIFTGEFMLGGHSKGGNLAVYAAVMAKSEHKEKITAVFNHDGPGFLPEVFATKAFEEMHERIHKSVPQTAIVGLLLEQHECYSVVTSNSYVFLQHDPFSWVVSDGDFVRIKEVNSLSKYTNRTLNNWLNHVDKNTRQVFIDTLYSIISNTKAATFSDLLAAWQENIKLVYDGIKTTDSQVRKLIIKTIGVLIKVSTSEMKDLLLNTINSK